MTNVVSLNTRRPHVAPNPHVYGVVLLDGEPWLIDGDHLTPIDVPPAPAPAPAPAVRGIVNGLAASAMLWAGIVTAFYLVAL